MRAARAGRRIVMRPTEHGFVGPLAGELEEYIRFKASMGRHGATRCVCSIESGPCERVDVFHVSGRFWSTSACGEKRTPARPAWTSFPS